MRHTHLALLPRGRELEAEVEETKVLEGDLHPRQTVGQGRKGRQWAAAGVLGVEGVAGLQQCQGRVVGRQEKVGEAVLVLTVLLCQKSLILYSSFDTHP